MAAPAPTTTPATNNNTTTTASTAIKVFVGNLAFRTRDSELQQQFATVGNVIRAKVIRDPGRRSLGYGFVEMATIEDAKKAVDAMNKKDIDGRQINVELAKPRDENAPRRTPPTTTTGGAPSTAQRGGRGGARGRGGRGGARGGRRTSGNTRANNGQPPQDRKPSKTTLYVSNLPFQMDEAAFQKLFADKGFKPTKTTVVKRQNGRSRGYGFVEFDTEENQQKALNAINNQTIEGRQISVRVALTEAQPTQQQQQPQATGTQQAAPAQQGKQEAAPAAQQQPAQQAAPAQQKPAAQQPAQQSAPAQQKPAAQAPAQQQPAAQQKKAPKK